MLEGGKGKEDRGRNRGERKEENVAGGERESKKREGNGIKTSKA